MQTDLYKYIAAHSQQESEALRFLVRQTHLRTDYPHMLSGSVQGAFLSMLVRLSGARNAVEIGSFTGYSSIWIASALPDGGHLDSLEVNDELEDLMRDGWEKAGVSDKISLHIGDASDFLASRSGEVYDFAFVDANKREYLKYYELLLPLMRPGGLIVADDVLWDGKVYDPARSDRDAQTNGLVAFNDFVASDDRVETVMIPLRDGLSLIRKK